MNILEAYGTRISAVLLDLEMPVMNGYDVLRAIKDHSIYEKIRFGHYGYIRVNCSLRRWGGQILLPSPLIRWWYKKRVDNAIKNAQK